MSPEVDTPMWGIKEVNGCYYRKVPPVHRDDDRYSWELVNFDDVAW